MGLFLPQMGLFLPQMGLFLPQMGLFLPQMGLFLPQERISTACATSKHECSFYFMFHQIKSADLVTSYGMFTLDQVIACRPSVSWHYLDQYCHVVQWTPVKQVPLKFASKYPVYFWFFVCLFVLFVFVLFLRRYTWKCHLFEASIVLMSPYFIDLFRWLGTRLCAPVRSCALHIDGLVQNCSNSSALAMELLQSCTKLSIKDMIPTISTYSYRK